MLRKKHAQRTVFEHKQVALAVLKLASSAVITAQNLPLPGPPLQRLIHMPRHQRLLPVHAPDMTPWTAYVKLFALPILTQMLRRTGTRGVALLRTAYRASPYHVDEILLRLCALRASG